MRYLGLHILYHLCTVTTMGSTLVSFSLDERCNEAISNYWLGNLKIILGEFWCDFIQFVYYIMPSYKIFVQITVEGKILYLEKVWGWSPHMIILLQKQDQKPFGLCFCCHWICSEIKTYICHDRKLVGKSDVFFFWDKMTNEALWRLLYIENS